MFSCVKAKTNSNFAVKLAERSNRLYVIMECIELNWLCKHMKKIRSSQTSISINPCTKHSFSLWVSLSCFAVVPRGICGTFDIYRYTKLIIVFTPNFRIFSLFWIHARKYNIQANERLTKVKEKWSTIQFYVFDLSSFYSFQCFRR